jgi:hypothetical protein
VPSKVAFDSTVALGDEPLRVIIPLSVLPLRDKVP